MDNWSDKLYSYLCLKKNKSTNREFWWRNISYERLEALIWFLKYDSQISKSGFFYSYSMPYATGLQIFKFSELVLILRTGSWLFSHRNSLKLVQNIWFWGHDFLAKFWRGHDFFWTLIRRGHNFSGRFYNGVMTCRKINPPNPGIPVNIGQTSAVKWFEDSVMVSATLKILS